MSVDVSNVLSDFQFVGSSVLSFTMQNDFINIANIPETAKRSVDVSYTIGKIGKETINGTELLNGLVDLYLSVSIVSGDEQLHIELCIRGCFDTRDEENEDEFKNMLGLNGCTTLYTISRALIMSMTAQASVEGSVVLPMMNTFKLNEEIEKEKEE